MTMGSGEGVTQKLMRCCNSAASFPLCTVLAAFLKPFIYKHLQHGTGVVSGGSKLAITPVAASLFSPVDGGQDFSHKRLETRMNRTFTASPIRALRGLLAAGALVVLAANT